MRGSGPYNAKTRRGPMRVKYIPVKDGDSVSLGATMMPGEPYNVHYAEHVNDRYPHVFLGFKPGTGTKPFGWIVVLVDESAAEASKPIKHHSKRRLRAIS